MPALPKTAALDRGGAVLVPSVVHLVEIGKGSRDLGSDPLTRMLAPLVESRRVLWIRSLADLCRLEWAKVAARYGDGRLDPEMVFAPSALLAGGMVSSDAVQTIAEPGFLRQVKIARDSALASEYAEKAKSLALRGLSESQERRIAMPKDSRSYSEVQRVCRVYSWLPADVDLPTGFRADLSRMPACRVRVAYEEGSDLAGSPVEANDAEDWFHLAGAAYCDIAFADKRTFDRLSKARYLPACLSLNRHASDILGAL
jgi:hypothetical protein